MSLELWKRMCNAEDHEARMPHDGYLKLFQLKRPVLGSYDAIFVDEAQDCNPGGWSRRLQTPQRRTMFWRPSRKWLEALQWLPILSSGQCGREREQCRGSDISCTASSYKATSRRCALCATWSMRCLLPHW